MKDILVGSFKSQESGGVSVYQSIVDGLYYINLPERICKDWENKKVEGRSIDQVLYSYNRTLEMAKDRIDGVKFLKADWVPPGYLFATTGPVKEEK